MEMTKKYFVSTAGHSKLREIAFEKSLACFPFCFSTDAFFRNDPSPGGIPYYFWVRNSVAWPERTLLLAKSGFCSFWTSKTRPREPQE